MLSIALIFIATTTFISTYYANWLDRDKITSKKINKLLLGKDVRRIGNFENEYEWLGK